MAKVKLLLKFLLIPELAAAAYLFATRSQYVHGHCCDHLPAGSICTATCAAIAADWQTEWLPFTLAALSVCITLLALFLVSRRAHQ